VRPDKAIGTGYQYGLIGEIHAKFYSVCAA
jgi:hypothetical protein